LDDSHVARYRACPKIRWREPERHRHRAVAASTLPIVGAPGTVGFHMVVVVDVDVLASTCRRWSWKSPM